MKNKYQRMNKEQQEKIRAEYKSTSKGQMQIKRLNRLCVTGIVGIVLGIALIIYSLVMHEKFYEFITPVILIIFSIVFIVKSWQLRIEAYNDLALSKKNIKV